MYICHLVLFFIAYGEFRPIASEIKIKDLEGDDVVNANNETIWFDDKDDIEFLFPLKNSNNEFIKNIKLVLNLKSFKVMNVTIDDVRKAWVKTDESGDDYIVFENGKEFQLGIKVTNIAVFKGSSGKDPFVLNIEKFQNMTMKDIEGDPTLLPVRYGPIPLEASEPICHLKGILVTANGTAVNVSINDKLVGSYAVNYTTAWEKTHALHEGLAFIVINPLTCSVTYSQVMHTGEFGGSHDLFWGTQTVSEGRLVITVSIRDGSSFLERVSKEVFSEYGSSWVNDYMYRDMWLTVFMKGGKFLAEAIIPNMSGNYSCSASPISIELARKDFANTKECPKWGKGHRWELRKQFCETHDGFGELCSCETPFEIEETPSNSDLVEIPIVIVAGNRTRYLYRSEGKDTSRIATTVRFALYNALKVYPNSDAFILLEEDLYLSPDFYSYMKQMKPIFHMDDTIYCVNAFNHLSYPHSSKDPSMTYRTNSFPAYGWMMSREILNQIIPRWLPASKVHDWDYFVGSFLVRGDRECIIPDINRSFHWSSGGFHSKSLWFAERLYLSRTVNMEKDVILRPIKQDFNLSRLLPDNYEKELEMLIKQATPLTITDADSYDILDNSMDSFVIYTQKVNASDELAFMMVGNELNIWNVDGRDHHNDCWRFYYKRSLVLVIGYPMSKYSRFKPLGYKVLTGNEMDRREILSSQAYDWAVKIFPLRTNSTPMPTINPHK